MEMHDLYRTQQEALASLVLAHPDRSGNRVPACPEWTVHDLLAHLVELSSDAATGRLPVMDLLEQWRDDGVAQRRDGMTADQVDRVEGEPAGELVSRWRETTLALAPMLNGAVPFPEPAPFGLAAILVTDLVIHDQDARGALRVHNAPPGPASSLALATYLFGVDYRVRQLGLPALGVRYGNKTRLLGTGDPAATVSATRFELLRAFGGRRSRRQILAFDWDGDPGPYVALLPAYGERRDDLVECHQWGGGDQRQTPRSGHEPVAS
jgi:uncharacterized protein (TIGR03083 family)